jgi:hypothetical protein
MPPKSKSAAPAEVKKAPCDHDNFASRPSPWCLNKGYLVRTVTTYICGRLVAIYDAELVFEDAAWVADTGRFSDALKNGALSEVEPMPGPVIVARGAIADAGEWNHTLPLARK